MPSVAVLAAALALLIGAVAWARGADAPTSDRQQQAPTFTLPTVDGTTFDLAAQRGHPVVLYFMAPCPPSLQGSREIARTLDHADAAGAMALVIDADAGERPADLSAFVRETGVVATATIHFGIDADGAILGAYRIQTLETTVVIDARGREAYRGAGSLASEQLAQVLRKVAGD